MHRVVAIPRRVRCSMCWECSSHAFIKTVCDVWGIEIAPLVCGARLLLGCCGRFRIHIGISIGRRLNLFGDHDLVGWLCAAALLLRCSNHRRAHRNHVTAKRTTQPSQAYSPRRHTRPGNTTTTKTQQKSTIMHIILIVYICYTHTHITSTYICIYSSWIM